MTAREFLVEDYCGFYDEFVVQEINDISTAMEEYAQQQVKLFAIPDVINWVVCKDALPKHETDVICYCLDFGVRVGRKTGNFWFIDGYSSPQDITHWQELPEPPCL